MTITVKQTDGKITFKDGRKVKAIITHVCGKLRVWVGNGEYKDVSEYYNVFMPTRRGCGMSAGYLLSEFQKMIARTCEYCEGFSNTAFVGLEQLHEF